MIYICHTIHIFFLAKKTQTQIVREGTTPLEFLTHWLTPHIVNNKAN